MKKISTILTILFLFVISVSAQTEHMKFMGIPITGTPVQMGAKLRAKGFVFKEKLDEDIREYTGKFAGSNVTIDVVSRNNLVWKILVAYPEVSSFSRLRNDYNDMVTQFSIKYGSPSKHYEFFKDPYYDGDGYELQALELDKCTYFTIWKLDYGNIAIQMSSNASLWISYEDAEGVKEKHYNENKQIQNDI